MSLRDSLAFSALIFAFHLEGALSAEEFNFYFKTSPSLERVRPLDGPVTISLLVTAADGRPVKEAWAEISVDAPKPGRFFSTDFPLVEGSRLTEMRLPLRQGKAEWKYIFPVRGDYGLTAHVITVDGKKASKTFQFTIRENQQKWIYLGLFTLGLFAFGVVAGRIFTSSTLYGTKRSAAGLLIAVGCFAASAEITAAQETGRREYFGWLEIEPATVGKPSRVRWKLGGEAGAEKSPALLTLTMTHLEKGKTVFSLERVPVDGEFAMNFHFTDGAEYRVTAIANVMGRGILRTEQTLSVTGVEPPWKAMMPAITFFVLVIALGLGVGRWSKRWGSTA